MSEPFTQWGVPLPATTPKPDPTRHGMIVHMMRDVTRHSGEPAWYRFIDAHCDDEKEAAALAEMPLATVTYVEMPDDWPPDVMPPY